MVLNKRSVHLARFLGRVYNALIDFFVITFPSLAFFGPAPLGDSRISSIVHGARPHNYGPRHPCHLRGHGHGDLVDMHSAFESVEPLPDPVF